MFVTKWAGSTLYDEVFIGIYLMRWVNNGCDYLTMLQSYSTCYAVLLFGIVADQNSGIPINYHGTVVKCKHFIQVCLVLTLSNGNYNAAVLKYIESVSYMTNWVLLSRDLLI